jgi:hypothetical protein
MDWTCGAGQVKDAVHFQKDRLGNIVADKFEVPVIPQVGHVLETPGKVIV